MDIESIKQLLGTTALDLALKILAASYRRLGVDDLAQATDKVRAANVAPDAVGQPEQDRSENDHWWKFWN